MIISLQNNQSNALKAGLIILAFVFTVLSPADLFPDCLGKSMVMPDVLKAVPCILVWVKLQIRLVTRRF